MKNSHVGQLYPHPYNKDGVSTNLFVEKNLIVLSKENISKRDTEIYQNLHICFGLVKDEATFGFFYGNKDKELVETVETIDGNSSFLNAFN